MSVKCSPCMDQPAQMVVNTGQTDGLGAQEPPGCDRHQTPVKRRGSGMSQRSSSACRTELTGNAHVPHVAQSPTNPTNFFTMETGASLVHPTAFLSLQPSSSISASHPVIP